MVTFVTHVRVMSVPSDAPPSVSVPLFQAFAKARWDELAVLLQLGPSYGRYWMGSTMLPS